MRKSTFGLLMIDTADILASADGEEARWEAITRIARMVGANAVTAGTFRWDTKEPDYVRSSMDPLWIERYAEGGFHEIDPIMLDIQTGTPQRFYDFTAVRRSPAAPVRQRLMLDEAGAFDCNYMLASTWRDGARGKTVTMDWRSDPRELGAGTARAFAAVASMLAVALEPSGEESHEGWAFTRSWQALSPPERDVLSHLAAGLPVYLIGEILKLTEFEVWRRLHSAARKMKAQSPEQTLALAIARRQITP